MITWYCTICCREYESEGSLANCNNCGADPKSIIPLEKDASDPESTTFAGIPESLEEVRDRARKKLQGICAVYPACDGQRDKICQREAYGKPIGFGGAGSGASFTANVAALKKWRLKTRLVGEHFEPAMSFTFCNRHLSMPVMGASTGGISRYNDAITERDFCRATVRGCAEAGTLTWRGDSWFYTLANSPSLDTLETEGGNGIPIFKPRAQDILKKFIERAERAQCPAVGVDLDGCGSTIMARHGQPVFRKTPRDLKELVEYTSLPFITKGIMSPEDAEACAEAGVSIIAVSNHGGRVLDHTPGVAEVLPEIVDRVRGKVTITADGGIRTGYDVLKMLALGADAVLLGRDIIRAAVGAGTVGVRLHMERMHKTLKQAMLMTGCSNLSSVNSDILIER